MLMSMSVVTMEFGEFEFKRCFSVHDYDRWLGLLNMLNDCALIDNRADCV